MTEHWIQHTALTALAGLSLAAAGLPQATAASFDCAKARTAVEQMICGEWQLERLDERMATLFERAREAEGADRDALLDAQRAWLQTRDACTDTACIEQAYRERIATLGGGSAANAGKLEREVIDGGQAVRLADKRGDLEVEAVFPVLPGDDDGIRAANASIERAFREPLEEFRGQYGEFIEESGEIHVGPPWAFSLGYQGVHATDTLIAVDGGGYMYTGGAHGGALYLPLVLARQTSAPIEPAELFREDSDWLEVLSTQSRARLREIEPFSTEPDLVDDDWFQEGTAPTAENFGLLLPTAEGIRVTFTQYQVGPYAIGDFRVTVPYAALRAQLAPMLFPDHGPEVIPDGTPDGPQTGPGRSDPGADAPAHIAPGLQPES